MKTLLHLAIFSRYFSFSSTNRLLILDPNTVSAEDGSWEEKDITFCGFERVQKDMLGFILVQVAVCF